MSCKLTAIQLSARAMGYSNFGFALDVFEEAALDEWQQSVIRILPDLVVEDFDFDGAGVAGGIDGVAEAAQLNDAVAHHDAAHEDAGEGDRPVGDMEAGDASAGALDLGHDVGVPPDVEGVDRSEEHTS